jgi:hypothetical protein
MSEMPRQLSARVDDELARHIRTLAPTGLSYSEIIKQAVAQFATVYRVAVENGVAEPDEIPKLTAYRYELPPKPQPPRTGAITLKETPHEDRSPIRPDVPRPRPAGLGHLDLAGLRLGRQARETSGAGEVRPGVPHPEQAVR